MNGRHTCVPSCATQIPRDLHFLWSWKTGGQAPNGKRGTLVWPVVSLKVASELPKVGTFSPGTDRVQAGKEDFHRHFHDTLNLHFKTGAA